MMRTVMGPYLHSPIRAPVHLRSRILRGFKLKECYYPSVHIVSLRSEHFYRQRIADIGLQRAGR